MAANPHFLIENPLFISHAYDLPWFLLARFVTYPREVYMEGVSVDDLLLFSQCVEALYRCEDINAFPALVMQQVARILDGKFYSYNEINMVRNRAIGLLEPPTYEVSEVAATFMKYAHQHPVFAHHQRTGDGQAAKVSDFLTVDQWHATDIYQHLYREMDVQDQISVCLPAPKQITVAIVISRDKRNFTERDRVMLNLFRTHMTAAYELCDRMSRLKHDADTSASAVASMNVGLVRVSQGKITFISPLARQWIEKHLPDPLDEGRLPGLIDRWLTRTRQAFASRTGLTASPTIAPLRIESSDEALEIRWKAINGDDLLLIEAHDRIQSAAPLETLGLTPREAEVLYWVTEGKTNSEIAIILGSSARTVQKHLQRIFTKLNVQTRTAAAMRATEVWQETRRGGTNGSTES